MKSFTISMAIFGVALVPAFVAGNPQEYPNRHASNLKRIGMAMRAYHDGYNKLPPAAVLDREGKPLLSWRVLLLPLLDEQELAREFNLDEPWDSPHNIKLLEKMPSVYGPTNGSTTSKSKKELTRTCYRVFQGPGTVFEPKRAVKLTEVTDGASNTIMVVEASNSVPWTKPDELTYEEKRPLAKLGGHTKGSFAVLMCDGSVHEFRDDCDERMLRAAILRADGLRIDFERLDR